MNVNERGVNVMHYCGGGIHMTKYMKNTSILHINAMKSILGSYGIADHVISDHVHSMLVQSFKPARTCHLRAVHTGLAQPLLG